MKVAQDSYNVQSTMHGEKIAMGIAVEDMSHIMGVMTDLYKDRLLAVIREYSTNALDAHIEAGVSLPIEVILPSALSPSLRIRDYGTGLSVEDIRTIYSQYGRSTKRSTNDQVGMLGLGCKSALTYTSQFTVASVKDGQRVTVLVARDEDGSGSMQILGTEATADANGTEVSVAIRREDHRRAETLSAEFFSYWTEGAVTVNGQAPKRFEGLRVTDSLFITKDYRASKIVMGNVAYPHEINVHRDLSVVAFVPIGAVKPTPSRESLMDTAATKAAVAAIETQFVANVQGAIQREINKCSSPQEAVRVVVEWSRYIPNASREAGDYTYKGIQLPTSIKERQPGEGIETTSFRDYGRTKSATSTYRDIPVSMWPGSVWVANFAPDKFTATHKNKLRKWCDDNKIGQDGEIQNFVLLRGAGPTTPFIDPALVVEWETIKAIKLDPKTRSAYSNYPSRISGSFDIQTESGLQREVLGTDLRQNLPMFWVHGNRYDGRRHQAALNILYPQGWTLVLLPQNRIAKFCRETPKAIPVRDALDAGYKVWRAKQDDDDLLALALHSNYLINRYKMLDPTQVNDPEVQRVAKVARRKVQKLIDARNTFRYVINTSDLDVKAEDPLDAYPLYNERVANHDHTYKYLNMIYAESLTSQP